MSVVFLEQHQNVDWERRYKTELCRDIQNIIWFWSSRVEHNVCGSKSWNILEIRPNSLQLSVFGLSIKKRVFFLDREEWNIGEFSRDVQNLPNYGRENWNICEFSEVAQNFPIFGRQLKNGLFVSRKVASRDPGWPKLLIIQFSYMRNFLSYNFIQFHTYRKLYENSMISIFPYMKIVW